MIIPVVNFSGLHIFYMQRHGGHDSGASPSKRSRAGDMSSDTRRREKSNDATLRDQTKLVNELKKTNDQLRAALREKYPDEVDQRYLGIWVEKKGE